MRKNIIMFIVLLSPVWVWGQVGLQTKSVSIFQGGNAFFIKEGQVPLEGGIYKLRNEDIPMARFGTLWFGSSASIAGIRSYTDTVNYQVKGQAQSIAELLAANEGAKASLHTERGQIVGVIKQVVMEKEKPVLVHIVLDDNHWLTMPPDQVKSVSFLSSPKLDKKPITRKKVDKVVEVQFGSSKASQPLDVMYLQQGLSWSPFYYLELIDDKKARLTLRTEVVNDAEDLRKTNVNFVVGVPNFQYAGSLSNLVKFSQQINPQKETYAAHRMKKGYAAYDMEEVVFESMPSFDNQLTGQQVEDYYFYPLSDITLAKGERAQYQLFAEELNYTHVYTSDISSGHDYTSMHRIGTDPERKSTVYHSIEIQNDSKNPLAEAPAFMVKKNGKTTSPLAQDKLSFTPIKGSTEIRIAETPEIEVKSNELILDKSDQGTNFWGRRYYKVKMQGVVKVKNYKREKLTVEVRNKVHGKTLSTSHPWEVLWQKVNSFSPNDQNYVQWEVTLKPGEEKTIKYEFEVFTER